MTLHRYGLEAAPASALTPPDVAAACRLLVPAALRAWDAQHATAAALLRTAKARAEAAAAPREGPPGALPAAQLGASVTQLAAAAGLSARLALGCCRVAVLPLRPSEVLVGLSGMG